MTPMDMADLDTERLSARLTERPQSPLFARLAELYLAEKRAGDALALCENGVKLYPAYAAGHIMLGKCYQAMGRVGEARSAFHQALDLAPYNTVVQNLLISLPEPAASIGEEKKEEELAPPVPDAPPLPEETVDASPIMPLPELSVREEPVPAPVSEVPEEAAAHEEAPEFDPYPTFEEYIAQHPAQQSVMSLDAYLKGRTASALSAQPEPPAPAPAPAHEASTDFESIALKLQNAGRIIPADHTLPAPAASAPSDTASGTQSTIVTQTMAEIYAAQNEFQAAIDAYEELIRKQPEQAKVFQQRIDAIRLLMGTV